MEKLDYLIKYLLQKNKEIKIKEIPTNEEGKKRLYRSLCNIREPRAIDQKYIKIENEYLQEELRNKYITDVQKIEAINTTFKNNTIENSDQICLWKGDITTLKIDAIVNAANSKGLGCFIPCHKCIDNQIHTFAGVQLRIECNEIMKQKDYYLPTGKAFITSGYNLPSKYVIHTVGPIVYDQVTEKEEIGLVNAYTSCLELAKEKGIRTIGFPCISTGEFRFPKELAVKYAFLAIQSFLAQNKNSFEKIVLNVYSEEDYEIYERYIRKSGKH